ncbi:3'-5' RNA exonuclease complex component [Marasmius crinis-equi]|uniref:3'-5' RNA exonuclease complex component n=1 Tax=Marasmius crinis-equi TaxID=585013 RepID=A0ABR3FE42_9AGAR
MDDSVSEVEVGTGKGKGKGKGIGREIWKGHVKKLADDLRAGASPATRDMSAERTMFEREIEEERTSGGTGMEGENEASAKVFEPGTFVEIRKPNVILSGVILGTQYNARVQEYVTLTNNGSVWPHSKDAIMFDVPSLVDPDIIARCGLGMSARDNVQHAARVEVLKRLRHVDRAVQEAAQGISRTPDALYNSLKSPDPTKPATVSAAEAARLLFAKPTMVKVYATHQFMMANPLYFTAGFDYQINRTFTVQAKETVDLIQTVTGWTKQAKGPIQSFVDKARRVREVNVELLEELRVEEPRTRPAKHKWDDNDRTIIKFLLSKLRLQLGAQMDPSTIGTYHIVQKLIEGEEIDDATVQRLLIELGVLPPWGDLTPLAAGLLDGHREKRGAQLVEKSYANRGKVWSDPLGPEDFYPTDPLESVRHDFGDLPVYIIDDPTALELDDGMSIEAVPNEPGAFWIHAHIANPTHILPPTHAICQETEVFKNSIYLYHRSYPMLPREFTHHEQHSMSLSGKEPQNVLTFSAKVNSNFDLLDYQVRAGIVRNKIFTSYDALNAALGWEKPKWTYPFGGNPAKVPAPADLSQTDVENLQNLHEVSHDAWKRRLRDGAFSFSYSRASLYDVEWPEGVAEYSLEPTRHTGFPKVNYRVVQGHDLDVGAMSIVAEVMKLACRVASVFCRDRGIPMIRRYATPPVINSESAYQDLLDGRTRNGFVYYSKGYEALTFDSIGGFSVEPKGHFGLGVPEGEGYTRVTSPLRRHSDLVAHWQIQNALLGKPPLYGAEWMTNYTVQIAAKSRMATRLEGVHEAYYHILFAKRWREERQLGKHQDVSDPFDNLVVHNQSWPSQNAAIRQYHCEGEIRTLGLKAVVVDSDFNTPPGQAIPVTFLDALLGLKPKFRTTPKRN